MPSPRKNVVPQSETPTWVAEAVSALPPIARIDEVAALIRMTPRTVRRLMATGRLHAVRARETGSARALIPRGEVARYLASLEGGAL